MNDIPKGSRLAVSTNLLACLIALCMRATNQIQSSPAAWKRRPAAGCRARHSGRVAGRVRRRMAGFRRSLARHQADSRRSAQEGDPEFGISRGRLLPNHQIFGPEEVTPETREKLQQSLVLVHGGMAQDVGPILEMVTEKYLLRSEDEWRGRGDAIRILDDVIPHLKSGDIRSHRRLHRAKFRRPHPDHHSLGRQSLHRHPDPPRAREKWATISGVSGCWAGCRAAAWDFCSTRAASSEPQDRLQAIMSDTKRRMEHAVPFAMEPVVYDFAINEHGTEAALFCGDSALMPAGYYALTVPALLRMESRLLSPVRRARTGTVHRRVPDRAGIPGHGASRFRAPDAARRDTGHRLPEPGALLDAYGFDRDAARTDPGRPARRPHGTGAEPPSRPAASRTSRPDDLYDATRGLASQFREIGMDALAAGSVAVVRSPAAWAAAGRKGAGIVKALNPFCKLGGKHRSFIEVHLAKSRQTGRVCGAPLPHVITTSYLTHDAIEAYLARGTELWISRTRCCSPPAGHRPADGAHGKRTCDSPGRRCRSRCSTSRRRRSATACAPR